MKHLWDYFTHLGIKNTDDFSRQTSQIATNRLNTIFLLVFIFLNVATAIIREVNGTDYTIHTKVLLYALIFLLFNLGFASLRWHLAIRLVLIFVLPPLLVIIPSIPGSVQEFDLLAAPLIILSFSIIPQWIIDPDFRNTFYSVSLLYFLILISFIDQFLSYLSHEPLRVIESNPAFHMYYKLTAITAFLTMHITTYFYRRSGYKSRLELNRLNRTKDLLFSIIGHDLKNYLSDIMGFSKLSAREDLYSKDKIEEFHKHLEKSAKDMNQLLKNLMDWSKIQRDNQTFNPAPIDLRDLTGQTISLYKYKASEKKIALLTSIREPLMVQADKNLLESVLRNLVSNAIKFTDQGGSIILEASVKDNKAIVTVSDSGRGLESEEISKLFQLNNTRSKRGTGGEGGAGLGLLLCKDLIDLHGEHIWAESKPGRGSDFRFTLPLAGT